LKALPKDLPPKKSTVHDYLELWNWDGTPEARQASVELIHANVPADDRAVAARKLEVIGEQARTFERRAITMPSCVRGIARMVCKIIAELRRRAAIEPAEHRMGRANAVLAAAGHNFHLLLTWLGRLLSMFPKAQKAATALQLV
jgi:hypothetical protein